MATMDLFGKWGQVGQPGTSPGTSMTISPETGRQSRFQEMMDVVNRRSGQRETDIRGTARGRSAGIASKLARLGMGNTTVGTSLQGGVTREMEAELRREADAGIGQRLGVLGQRTGFIEAEDARRESETQRLATARLQAQSQIAATRISAAPALMEQKRKDSFYRMLQTDLRSRSN